MARSARDSFSALFNSKFNWSCTFVDNPSWSDPKFDTEPGPTSLHKSDPTRNRKKCDGRQTDTQHLLDLIWYQWSEQKSKVFLDSVYFSKRWRTKKEEKKFCWHECMQMIVYIMYYVSMPYFQLWKYSVVLLCSAKYFYFFFLSLLWLRNMHAKIWEKVVYTFHKFLVYFDEKCTLRITIQREKFSQTYAKNLLANIFMKIFGYSFSRENNIKYMFPAT